MIKQKLIEKFGGVINHMSCIYLRDGEERLRSFLQDKKYDTIIEIGTYQGVSAAVLSDYAKKVYTFDVVKKSLIEKIFTFLGIKNVETFIGSPKQIETKIKSIFKKEKVELCFIDGEHFNGELEKDFDMCKSCERILIHDYANSFPEVFNFVNSLKGYDKTVNDTFVLLTKSKKEVKKTTSRRSVKSKKANKSKPKT